MIKKIVSVSVGRRQLLSSFLLSNGVCVCFSERGIKYETRISWRGNCSGESVPGERVGGLRDRCASVERQTAFGCVQVVKIRNNSWVGLIHSVQHLEIGHVTSAQGS